MSDTPPANPPDDPAQLRKKLEDALSTNRKNEDRIRALEAENTIHSAGLGHLNEHQRVALSAVVPKDSDVTADVLKGAATSLGFPLTPVVTPPPANADGTPPTGDQPPADPNQPGQTLPPTLEPGTQFLTPGPSNSAHPDPRVVASITGLTQQEHAHIMSLRGGQDGGSFEEKLGKAKSKEETLAVIRQQGAGVGIMLDSDLD